jgi:general secretion pathway protein D
MVTRPAPASFRHRRPAVSGRAYSIALSDADIPAVANEVLGQDLKIPFLIDPGVSGKVSLRLARPLSGEALLEAFEAALALDDVAMVRGPGGVALMPKAKARTQAPLRRLRSADEPLGAGFQIVAAPLAYASAADVGKAVEAAGGTGVVVKADDQSGAIILAGSSGELRAALQVVRLMDRSRLSAGQTRTLQLRSAPPAAVAAELDGLLRASGVSGVSLVPIDRLDQLVISAHSPDALAEAVAWAARLDSPSHEEKTSLWIYHPQNLSADDLAQALNQLLSGAEPGGRSPDAGASIAPPPPGALPPVPRGGDATSAFASGAGERLGDPELRVSVEKGANTLMVMAPESRWAPLRAMLEQIDRPPPQILIEATVLEVTLGREFKTGVDWSVIGANGKLTVTNTQDKTGAVLPKFPGFSVFYLSNTAKAAIDALASKTRVDVVSAPKLVAVDNQTATLQVGDQVPIVNQTTQSISAPGAPLVENTEYRDTGIILKIRPRINGPESVLVDFSQEVSSVEPTTSSTINSPTIQQRRFESQMALKEGETVAVGGLISSDRSRNDQGIPFLKDIKGLGLLFKAQDDQNSRTEIIVLMTAHILHDRDEATQALDRLKQRMPAAGEEATPYEH